MALLTADLRSWLVPGLAGTIASIDAAGRPELARVWGARAKPGLDEIELIVQRSSGRGFLQALGAGGRAALVLIDVPTYRSRSFKGECRPSGDVPSDDYLDQCLAALDREFTQVGMAPNSPLAILSQAGDEARAMATLVLRVESVFDQSPKPGAGGKL